MKGNIKIFVSCYKECFFPQMDFLYPIQVGAASNSKRFKGILHDDEGENISLKNPGYCELTAQYWAWKNMDADYYGFFHYRRYMSFAEEPFESNSFQDVEMEYLTQEAITRLNLNPSAVTDKVHQYDIIATSAVNVSEVNERFHNNFDQYVDASYQYREDIDLLLDIIREKYPEFYATAYRYFFEQQYGYFCNMFIMEKKLFQQYSAWLFDILEEHEKRRDDSQYSIDGCRVSGYLGERLFGIFYMHMKDSGKYKTCELQRTLFKDVDVPHKISPACKQNNIPVVIAANDYYAPYISALLLSIRDSSSAENYYDILILSHDIKQENEERLLRLIQESDNFSLRFLDPGRLLDGYDLYTRGHFSIETYYRLVLPELLSDYDKVVYIDVDTIVLEDIAKLHYTDVEGYLLAASYDPDTAGLYNGFQPDKKEYMDRELRLENPYHYFQAGVLLMNLKEFRQISSTEQILSLAASKQWQLLDQDVLNVLCEHKVRVLDMSWNVMYDYAGVRIKEIIRLAPKWLYEEYIQARKHPKIIHYAGPEKPWMFPEGDFADVFWEYARRSPYYEVMLYRMTDCVINREIETQQVVENEECESQQVDDNENRESRSFIYRTLRCLWIYGPSHTLKEIRKRLR